jgi:uncharacterized protein with HEPN domain
LPFRDTKTHLRDILEAINYIESFLTDVSFEQYQADFKTKFAVERQMQVIAEAAVRLGLEADNIAPGPDWKGFRGMGNILRHAYHRVNDELIWNTAKDELPRMKDVILDVLKPPDASD